MGVKSKKVIHTYDIEISLKMPQSHGLEMSYDFASHRQDIILPIELQHNILNYMC
jgi:hypothetical protein